MKAGAWILRPESKPRTVLTRNFVTRKAFAQVFDVRLCDTQPFQTICLPIISFTVPAFPIPVSIQLGHY